MNVKLLNLITAGIIIPVMASNVETMPSRDSALMIFTASGWLMRTYLQNAKEISSYEVHHPMIIPCVIGSSDLTLSDSIDADSLPVVHGPINQRLEHPMNCEKMSIPILRDFFNISIILSFATLRFIIDKSNMPINAPMFTYSSIGLLNHAARLIVMVISDQL